MLPNLAIQLLTIANMTLTRQQNHDKLCQRNEWDSSYDFIVVGAGTSGSIVASRLSENPNWKVLLIEAGGGGNVILDIPLISEREKDSQDLNWEYSTVPQKHVCNKDPKKICGFRRGKVLGGSSAINGMNYFRGAKRDYDNWAQKYGAKGWDYNGVLPYFLKAENQTNSQILEEFPQYHSNCGPLAVSTIPRYEVEKQFVSLLEQKGYKNISDLNSPEMVDKTVGIVQQTIKDGHRLSTSHAYLEPIYEMRPNLHILVHSIATKIIIENDKAIGIQFTRNSKYNNVTANKEIIISGGVINSPQLLMLSGIGPKSHLQQLGIHVLKDLPVGNNLIDGLYTGFYYLPQMSQINENLTVKDLYEFYVYGAGPLIHLPSIKFAITTKYNNYTDWPDGGFMFMERELNDGYKRLILIALNIRVKSRGSVRLNSSDPFDKPLIDPNYYSHPDDIKVAIETIKELYRIVESDPKFKVLLDFNTTCKKCDSNSIPCDEFLECVAYERAATTFHSVGTCRMGSKSDLESVVDEKLKVIGINGLRVIDASIMPTSIEPGTYGTCVMIGEKGAQLIIDHYQ